MGERIDMELDADEQEMSPDLDATIQAGADGAFADLDLVDLNVVLHRADGEEKDATGGLIDGSKSMCGVADHSRW